MTTTGKSKRHESEVVGASEKKHSVRGNLGAAFSVVLCWSGAPVSPASVSSSGSRVMRVVCSASISFSLLISCEEMLYGEPHI